ncbi:sodium:solute symporter [Synoicihabitans lomoniglobus]|uniref:Sodium:solute symporter n=1 Tax=Synoicihabitans lomoniglobus TaxID=2909285 RepID=A0AAF0CRE9_9BACT|nr:sodium:solute symporter [Opitutaceae bacterium LMO-M01]WED66695.1 sodium:solute symporter [Opitutaceae bacterium LMO-M01]
MTTLDWIIIAAYFVVLATIAWYSSRKTDTTTDYFLAGRNVPWFVVGCSLLASNIGSEHIVGLAGNGASSGMAMAHWELHAWIMLMLGWVFVPFYYRSGVFTMPEFLERRFDSRSRWTLSIVSLIAYVFTKVSVTVYAGAVVFMTLLPDTFGSPENAFWVGALTTVVLTGIYTVIGGLRAVLYTEVAQTGLLLFGSVFITLFGLQQLGGWGELKTVLGANADNFALWRPMSDPDFPWLGIMIASPIVGIWYWCTDQYIVQRTLAARSLRDARRGAIFGGFLKVLPVFVFLIPGMIGYALHTKGIMIIPSKADGSTNGDMVFPTMVATLLPAGLRGIVVAGLLSALMSSLASLFNSCATLFTVDIYSKLRPDRSEKELVRVGRFATGCVVVLGVIWIPVMKYVSGGGLYQYLQSVQGYLAPPITATFLLGLFFKRINARGAFIGLTSGFVLGMIKLTVQALDGGGAFGDSGLLHAIGSYNFLYASGWLFLISIITVVVASLTAPAPSAEQLRGLTYTSITPEQATENRASWGAPEVWATVGVLALVGGIYVYFSFWLS